MDIQRDEEDQGRKETKSKESKESKLLRQQKKMENKKRFASMTTGIVFMPAGGKEGYVFNKLLIDLNRFVKKLNNSAVFGDIVEVKKKHDKIKSLRDTIWDAIKESIPRFHAFDPTNWQELNENVEERLRLIQRNPACVVAPIDDNVAAITMAVKVLSEKFMEYQAKSDFDKIKNVASLLKKIQEDVTEIIGNGTESNTTKKRQN